MEPETTADLWVLIADDESFIAAVLAAVVREKGYTAVVARNGQEALELARARRPALVITDLMMPHLDGAGLISALRRDGAVGLPVILITASALARAGTLGADAILAKPFAIDDVDALLDRYLGPAAADDASAVAD